MYYGTINKNLGDTFIVVWKVHELDSYFDGDLDSVIINESHICDLALLGCLKSIASINKYKHIRAYRHNEEIAKYIPDYNVEVVFGLHVGMAFEGAVGSQWKIDATFVSPDVTVASRLSIATDYYDVPILFSEKLFSTLSNEFKNMCRVIDCVTIKGVPEPQHLFTI